MVLILMTATLSAADRHNFPFQGMNCPDSSGCFFAFPDFTEEKAGGVTKAARHKISASIKTPWGLTR
jgi:hypothetical protein